MHTVLFHLYKILLKTNELIEIKNSGYLGREYLGVVQMYMKTR